MAGAAQAAAGVALGEAAVDVYADLTRLDSDLALAREKVESFSRDLERQMGSAVRSAQSGGVLPTRDLDNFRTQMSHTLNEVSTAAAAALTKLQQTTNAATADAAAGVAKVNDAVAAATKGAGDNVSGLTKDVEGLNKALESLPQLTAGAINGARNRPLMTSTAPAAVAVGGAGGGKDKAASQAARDAAALDAATMHLANAYSPLHAAQMRYVKDLETIDKLQKAGIFSAQDAAMFTEKAGAAYEKVATSQSKAYEWGKKAGDQLRQYGGILAAAVTAGAVLAAKGALEHAQAIKAEAESLRISSRAWQEWLFIAQQSNVSSTQLSTGFQNLEKAMGRGGTGAQKQTKLFKELGISLTDAQGHAKDAAAIMPELADKLARVGDANQKAAALQILFGESANEMGKLLEGGSGKINELAKAAEDLGVVLSDEQLQRADETANKLEEVKNVLAANIASVVANNATSIISLADALGKLTGMIIKFLGSHPEIAIAMLGALAGGRIGGAYGAVAGAIVGGAAGLYIKGQTQRDQDDSNKDLKFRAQKLQEAREARDKERANQNNPWAMQNAQRPAGYAQQEFLRQVGLWNKAVRDLKAGSEKPKTGGNIVLSDLNAPKPKKPPKAKQTPIDKNDDELLSLQEQILRIAQGQATNTTARAAIGYALLDIDKKQYERKLEADVHSKRLTQAEADRLMVAYGTLDAVKREQIDLQKREQDRKDQLAVTTASLGNDVELLGVQKDLARSTTRRGEIEEQLFDLNRKIEIAKLDETIASETASDTEVKIAKSRKEFLAQIEPLQREALRRANLSATGKFFDEIPHTKEQIDESIDQMRAANLEDQKRRAISFADDIGDAFGNMARSIMNLEDPLSILKNLLADLAKTFTEESIVRPVQKWAREKIGVPAAERVVGAPANEQGLWQKQIEASGLKAAEAQDRVAVEATRAAQALAQVAAAGYSRVDPLQAGGKGLDAVLGTTGFESSSMDGLGAGGQGLDAVMNTMPDFGAIGQDMDMFSSELSLSTKALGDNVQQLGNFGNGISGALTQILSAAASGGGGGGGGLLGTILKIGGAVAGGITASPQASLMPSVQATFAANPGIFANGGRLGKFADGGGLLKGPGTGRSDSIPAVGPLGETARFSNGEFITNARATSAFLPFLEGINSGRIPSMDALGGMLRGRTPQQVIDRSLNFSFGGINVQGMLDERGARRTGKMVAAEAQRELSRTMRGGMMHRD
jgi:hypothetical protein